MRLIRITVRNYRIHRELTLDLDPRRTLIGGSNEIGKSTLIEAMHRGLFLRAKTGGEIQKAMVSRLHPGHPEVEIEFETGGKCYSLIKRFSGQSGTAMLTESGGSSWPGDEAEAQLANLLQVDLVRGSGASQQWAHLWVWQGLAGGDPTRHANEQKDSLLIRLQSAGGGAAMQSERDAAVAGAFVERHEQLFNKNDDPKAGSEFAQAKAEETTAEEAVARARAVMARLENAVMEFREAEQQIAAVAAALATLGQQKASAEEKLARVMDLRADEKEQTLVAAGARDKHDALASAEARLTELRRDLAEARTALAAMHAEQWRRMENEATARKLDTAADATLQTAVEAVRNVRLHREAARANLELLERTLSRGRLDQTMTAVREARKRLLGLEETLAKMPAVSDAKVKEFHKLERDLSNAEAAIEAMAAGLELLAADAEVKLGDRFLEVGAGEILSEETDLHIGAGVHLRIRPGGGSRLGEARQRAADLRAKLARELDGCGFTTVAQILDAVRRRQQVEADAATARTRIETLDAGAIERDFENAAAALAQAAAESERRSAMVPDAAQMPRELDAARSLHIEASADLDEAERSEEKARIARAEAASEWKRSGEAVTAHRADSEQKKSRVSDLEAQIRLMLETHGDDELRARALGLAREAREQVEALHLKTRERLRELQPEMLEADLARITRALDQHQNARQDAEQRRAVARSELQQDGSIDPRENLAMAEARLASVRQRTTRAERHADAVRLLHRLFREEQQSLAKQFTQPLMKRIAIYLECLFGPGAHAVVDLEDNEFRGLRLVRPPHEADGAFDFATLSGGTREQLAAAVRLAMAEILAEAHGGCLPVVFDDAFAFSDPDRVQSLQRMLDHAASRGLQVIILTCTPADYAGLGAVTLSLRP